MLNKNTENLPRHIGIIMDGNGRWAKKFDFPRTEGHKNAINSVRETVETCAELGVEVLTLYAFSTENWGRPEHEVELIMRLFEKFLDQELDNMIKNNIQFQIIGDTDALPDFVKGPLQNALERTRDNSGMILCLAINYGSRDEILRACKKIVQEVEQGSLKAEQIDEACFSSRLYTANWSDPDLIIRTSGEQRLSNFLLWQSAYSELYFTETLWPDFTREELLKALDTFSKRERRLGKV